MQEWGKVLSNDNAGLPLGLGEQQLASLLGFSRPVLSLRLLPFSPQELLSKTVQTTKAPRMHSPGTPISGSLVSPAAWSLHCPCLCGFSSCLHETCCFGSSRVSLFLPPLFF